MESDREKALEAAVNQITKRYGDGAVMRLGEAKHLMVEAVPTGSLALDLALGV
ncbi:MAG: recombinase RecA, partial [Anaerolineae bacterium SM23_ 63]